MAFLYDVYVLITERVEWEWRGYMSCGSNARNYSNSFNSVNHNLLVRVLSRLWSFAKHQFRSCRWVKSLTFRSQWKSFHLWKVINFMKRKRSLTLTLSKRCFPQGDSRSIQPKITTDLQLSAQSARLSHWWSVRSNITVTETVESVSALSIWSRFSATLHFTLRHN